MNLTFPFRNESDTGESKCPVEISAMNCEVSNIVFSLHEMPFYKKTKGHSKTLSKDKKIDAIRDFFPHFDGFTIHEIVMCHFT